MPWTGINALPTHELSRMVSTASGYDQRTFLHIIQSSEPSNQALHPTQSGITAC
jgi:hypothetical protein